MGRWNAGLGKRFNRFVRDLARATGAVTWVVDESGRRRERILLRYFKGVEAQRRGALHVHMMIERSDGKPFIVSKKVVRRIAMKHGFGHSVDAQRSSPERNAGYLAKYVTKTCERRHKVPWWNDDKTLIGDKMRATFRTWSSSRDWGDSMRFIAAAQTHWATTVARLPVWGDGRAAVAAWSRIAGLPVAPAGVCTPTPLQNNPPLQVLVNSH